MLGKEGKFYCLLWCMSIPLFYSLFVGLVLFLKHIGPKKIWVFDYF